MEPPLSYVALPETLGQEPGERRQKARRLFDSVADAYDRARPGYPAPLFDDLRKRCLSPGCTVLEVGCGTGQATTSLAAVAGEVWCVELGTHLAQRARENLAHLSNVTVLVGAFEEVDLPANQFDLVFSATAFHWVDPAIGYRRAARLLRPGGSLALCTNAHVAGGTQEDIGAEIAAAHAEICPHIGPWAFPSSAELTRRARQGGDVARLWSRIDRKFGEAPDVHELFAPPVVSVHEWTASYDTSGYVTMLGTQAPYLALDRRSRDRILERVATLVDDRLGGTVTKRYLAVLAVAPRA